MWQFHHAAEVFGRPIGSVYLRKTKNILRKDMHRMVLPLNSSNDNKHLVYVMWTSGHQSGNNDSEGEEQIIIVRHSKRLQDVRDMKHFIVDDYTQKRKGYKARRDDSERCRMAAPYILDKTSISLRPPKGYYGNFGENDNEYVDDNDFSSENGNQNTTAISTDDEDKMSLGNTMLCNNINKQTEISP